MSSELEPVVESALGQVRKGLGRDITLQKPPLVLGYAIDPKLVHDAIHAAAGALPPDAADPIVLTVSNVEVELDEEEDDFSPIHAGKRLGLTFRWPTTGAPPQVPEALEILLADTGSYAYAVDRGGEASITVLLKEPSTGV